MGIMTVTVTSSDSDSPESAPGREPEGRVGYIKYLVPVRRLSEADNCDCLLLRLEGCHISESRHNHGLVTVEG